MRSAVIIPLALAALLAPNARAQVQCVLPETQKLSASDHTSYQAFGHAVVVCEDVAVVGSPRSSDPASESGSVYVYRKTGDLWVEEQKLLASDSRADSFFGWSLALEDDWLVVGAFLDDSQGKDAGAAYVFHYDGSQWVETQKLVSPTPSPGDQFSFGLALSGTLLAIGSIYEDRGATDAGRTYLYSYDGSQWVLEQRIQSDDAAANDWFGWRLALNGSLLAAASPAHDVGDQTDAGAVYLFQRTPGATPPWSQVDKLTASNGADDDLFGYSLALQPGMLVVGAPAADRYGTNSGAAYVFRNSGGTWSEVQELATSNSDRSWSNFGVSATVSGDKLLIGSYFDDTAGTDAGAAFAFRDTSSGWIEIAKLLPSDGDAGDWFAGFQVGLDGDEALVGAKYDQDFGTRSGSAYAFQVPDLGLDADQDSLQPGDAVTLLGCGGTPGSPLALFLWEVDDVSLPRILALGTFQADGTWSLPATVPPQVSGITIQLKLFSCSDPAMGRGVLVSNSKAVTIQ